MLTQKVNCITLQGSESTSVQSANETVEVRRWDYEDLIGAIEDLKGEDTIESVFNCIEHHEDEYLRDVALYDVIRFYSKVRFLILLINHIFEEFQKGGEQ